MGTLKVKESGVWNPVGYSSPDEVWVGPDTPVSPSAELWYDTDEADASSVDMSLPWNNAWGVIAEARWASSWSSASTSAQVITATSGTNTFTAFLYASRRYRLYWQGMVTSTAAGDYVVLQHQINGGQHTENNAQYIPAANAQYFTWVESRYIPPADGNYTFQMTGRRGSTSTGTVSVINTGNNPLWLMVEDLGPISKVGVSPPAGQQMSVSLGNALGVVAVGDTTNNILALTTNPGVPVTTAISFTPQVGRRYRIRYQARALSCADNSSGYIALYIDGSNISLSDSWFSGTTNYAGRMFDWMIMGDGVPHTYQLYGVLNLGTITLHNQTASGNCYFHIEDVGPTVSPPLPLLPQPTPWIPVTYQNGWRDYGGQYPPGGFRKIGDVVSMRGLLAAGTVGSSTPAFLLPVGYRPRYFLHLAAASADIFGIVRVYTTGEVTLWNNAGANGWFSLDNVSFSVT